MGALRRLRSWMGNCTLIEIWSNATRWKTPYGNMSLYSNVYSIQDKLGIATRITLY
ncbi:hypothetical protein M1397_04115 [Candidatus Marsarchaeota archaeon]|nr:hypothetical protein [Candidatus Marsarchaeota archaeon]